MSVFSIIRRGRQQAKEHTQKQTETARNGDAKPAYKHIPTHAAADALAGEPPTWCADDKPRIIEENRRRSVMASAGVPRAASGLSNVMYPAAQADPLAVTQRSHSYHGPQSWQAHYHGMSAGVAYAVPGLDVPEVPRIPSLKGQGVERGRGVPPGLSRAMKGSRSVASSCTSISSLDGLVMKPLERPVLATRPAAPPTTAAPPTDVAPAPEDPHSRSSAAGAHRLHPRRQRRLSNASIDKPLSGLPKKKYPSTSRDSKPPPSTKGFSSIPPVPSIPALHRPASGPRTHSHTASASSTSSVAGSETSGRELRARSYRSRATPDSSALSTGSSTPSKLEPAPVHTTNGFVFPFTDGTTSAIPADPVSVETLRPAHKAPRREANRQRIATQTAKPKATQSHELDAQPRAASKPRGYYPSKAARFTETVTGIGAEPPPRPARPANWLMRRLSQSNRFSANENQGESVDRDGKNKLRRAKTGKTRRWSIGSGAR